MTILSAFNQSDRQSMRTIIRLASIKRRRLTYLSFPALADLHEVTSQLGIEGDVVEAGCALGGSAAVLAAAMESDRTLHLYDTFGVIPPPSEHDGEDVLRRYQEIVEGESRGIRGDVYYGYRNDLMAEVKATIYRYAPSATVELHQGLYEERFWPAPPVALAHLDCDWYASVSVCLERLWPVMVPGARIVVDDYEAWSGAKKAVDEFVADRDVLIERRTRLHLVKPHSAT
jgi:O-methyltransferase